MYLNDCRSTSFNSKSSGRSVLDFGRFENWRASVGSLQAPSRLESSLEFRGREGGVRRESKIRKGDVEGLPLF
jgi:hypothetical protein